MSTRATTILAMLNGFRRQRWSISQALVASLAMGTVGALFHLLLYRIGPFELAYIRHVVPAVFWTSAGIATWFLYRQVERTRFRSDAQSFLNSVLALALFALGVFGAVWCYWHHVCMEGHMGHPPYPSWHYLFDTLWVASLAASVIWTWRARSALSLGLAAFAAFLVCFRFLLGSAGGMYGDFPL